MYAGNINSSETRVCNLQEGVFKWKYQEKLTRQ